MNKRAFTLIELLIVVLIIAILAAIAIPNFMEFQTRAKVSRVKSDLRTIATGLEAYTVDEGTYPAAYLVYLGYANINIGLYRLTTPIAYLSNIPRDPFGDRVYSGEKIADHYEFGCGKAGLHYSFTDTNYPNDTWMLESAGPDNFEDSTGSMSTDGNNGFPTSAYPWPGIPYSVSGESNLLGLFYDPTNGTASRGQVFRAGGVVPPERLLTLFYQQATK